MATIEISGREDTFIGNMPEPGNDPDAKVTLPPVFDEASKFDIAVGGNVDRRVMTKDAIEHGKRVEVSKDVGGRAIVHASGMQTLPHAEPHSSQS